MVIASMKEHKSRSVAQCKVQDVEELLIRRKNQLLFISGLSAKNGIGTLKLREESN